MITDVQLLEVPLENTLSQLTQAIRFLAANDFLQGVEAYAGEADERERERNKITVVGEGAAPVAEEIAKVTEVTEVVKDAEPASTTDTTEVAEIQSTEQTQTTA